MRRDHAYCGYSHLPMNISFLQNSDTRFLSQVFDPVLRQQEIARLMGSRRRSLIGAIIVFILFMIQLLLLHAGEVAAIEGLVALGMYQQYYEIQNTLRLLLIAEQAHARQDRTVI